MAEVTEEQLKRLVETMVPKVDLETTGLKKFIKLMSAEVGYDLKAKKAFIKEALTEAINKMESGGESESEDDEDSVEVTPKKKKAKRGGGGGGGLAAVKEISPELAKFLKVEEGTKMARTDIVKSMWEYIRERQLQNPENKREIILDADMKEVFGCDTFTMFTMNKVSLCFGIRIPLLVR